jgi:hypothetical protein
MSKFPVPDIKHTIWDPRWEADLAGNLGQAPLNIPYLRDMLIRRHGIFWLTNEMVMEKAQELIRQMTMLPPVYRTLPNPQNWDVRQARHSAMERWNNLGGICERGRGEAARGKRGEAIEVLETTLGSYG